MKHEKNAVTAALALLLLPAFTATAWANSSWHWISETRPVDVLPWVILVTLAIETAAVCMVLRWKQTGKVFLVVCLANLVSFLLPYLFETLSSMQVTGSFADAFYKSANHWPSWIVGGWYLFLTLAAEVPLVYILLRERTEKPRPLLYTVIGANVLTTAITFVTERLLCQGRW